MFTKVQLHDPVSVESVHEKFGERVTTPGKNVLGSHGGIISPGTGSRLKFWRILAAVRANTYSENFDPTQALTPTPVATRL